LFFAQEKTTFAQASPPVALSTQIALPHAYSAKDVKILGDLDSGRASPPVLYSAHPPYRAFVFSAYGGEQVDIAVKGATRKAYVVLTDSTLVPLASGVGSLRFTLPYRGPYIEVWYIVFRDFEAKPARFTVQVKKLPGTTLAAGRQGVKTE
jgi:hypothetical protein